MLFSSMLAKVFATCVSIASLSKLEIGPLNRLLVFRDSYSRAALGLSIHAS
jgi:hypothetical protein